MICDEVLQFLVFTKKLVPENGPALQLMTFKHHLFGGREDLFGCNCVIIVMIGIVLDMAEISVHRERTLSLC